MSQDVLLAEVARLVDQAQSILFITGAGLSADSGMPTYRGVGGLYADADTEEGLPIEVALSGPVFARAPGLTWKYLWQIGSACVDAQPNDGHRAIARLEAEKQDVWVLTQNVDGLHRRAGTRQLVEVHGHAFDLFCTRCGKAETADAMIAGYRGDVPLPPRCRDCQGIVRPDVVLFEEMLGDRAQLGLAQLRKTAFDLVFSVGTSGLFGYIAHFVERAERMHIPCVEINPEGTQLSSRCSHCLRLGAAEALTKIMSLRKPAARRALGEAKERYQNTAPSVKPHA